MKPTGDSDQRAIRELTDWIAHPNEMGEAPESVEIIDKRTLEWPPEYTSKPFWLLRFETRTEEGEKESGWGIVGSVTFGCWIQKFALLPFEDLYASRCYSELLLTGLIREEGDPSLVESRKLLKSWNGKTLTDALCRLIAIPSATLKHSPQQVVVAQGSIDGAPGWAVMDGGENQWYPKSSFPPDTDYEDVLQIHVGRLLLKFPVDVSRNEFKKTKAVTMSSSEVVEAFKKKEDAVIRRFPKGRKTQSYEPDSQLQSLSKALEGYAQALVTLDRRDEIASTIQRLSPILGRDSYELGKAAFISGQYDSALKFLEKAFDGPRRSWGDEGTMLAAIYQSRGEPEKAKTTLVTCLQEVLKASRQMKGKDRDMLEEHYQGHRNTFLKLFPDLGEAFLEKEQLPKSSLFARE